MPEASLRGTELPDTICSSQDIPRGPLVQTWSHCVTGFWCILLEMMIIVCIYSSCDGILLWSMPNCVFCIYIVCIDCICFSDIIFVKVLYW